MQDDKVRQCLRLDAVLPWKDEGGVKKMAAEYEYFDVAYNKLVKLSADGIKRVQYENRE